MKNLKNNQSLHLVLAVALVLLVGVSIAYAALSTTLNITFGKITQNALTWNVAFNPTGTVNATAAGTSDTGRTCGAATVAATTVTVADTSLSKPGDKCTWALTVKNSGTVGAKLNTITPTAPSGTTCGTASGGNLVCGNITYNLTTDASGGTVLTTGGALAAGGTQTIYLVAKYTPTNAVQSTAITQTGAKFALVYGQN